MSAECDDRFAARHGGLMPVFPRPETDWKIYTHALDRDSMLTVKRISPFWFAACRNDWRCAERLKKEIWNRQARLDNGFSAGNVRQPFCLSASEARQKPPPSVRRRLGNRTRRVYKEKTLRYPLGTNDFKTVSGKSFDQKICVKSRFFNF